MAVLRSESAEYTIKLFDDERVLAIPKFIAVDKFGLSFWIEIN